jgi:large subunit ribosomal protein L17
MRHRYNKLKYLETGVVKRQLVVRNLLTALVKNWEIKTTYKRAKILKSVADKFFNKVKRLFDKYDDTSLIKIHLNKLANIYLTNDVDARNKFINVISPALKDLNVYTGFVRDYKLGFRKGDNSEVILIKLRSELLSNVWSSDVIQK